MTAPVRLRLYALVLVVGVAWQAPANLVAQPSFSGCSAELARLLGHAGWVTTSSSTITCSPAMGRMDVRGVRIALRDGQPRAGEPCADLYFNRAVVNVSSDGATARFAIFGGLSQGAVQVSPNQANMIDTRTAYVVESQLGTYEETVRNYRRGLVCELDPTFHFDCPTNREPDQLCLVWVRDDP